MKSVLESSRALEKSTGAAGEKSDAIELENNVDAGAQDRASQRNRNQQWKDGGAEQFINENDRIARGETPLTPPRPVTGGGGGGGQPTVTDGGTGTPGTGRTPTGGAGSAARPPKARRPLAVASRRATPAP